MCSTAQRIAARRSITHHGACLQARTEKEMAVIEMADDDTALPEDEMVAEIRFHVRRI